MKKMILKIIRTCIKILMPFIRTKPLNISNSEKMENIIKEYKQKVLFSKNDIVDEKSNDNIDLSIIIPVYNSEKYLSTCIESIIKQDTQYKFEILAINDGSTDKSLDILEKYAKKHDFIRIINQENKGISGARNTGINNAKGKYIGFIDNDDKIRKDYIEKLLNRAYENNADIVKCNHVKFNGESGEILGCSRHEDVSIRGYIGEKILEFKGYIWGGILKKELWKEFRFPMGYWYEDAITRIVIMRICSRFEYIDEDLYFYNVHSSNASKIVWSKKNLKCMDQYFLVKKLVEYDRSIGLKDDNTLYKILLYEFGPMLWTRTRNLDREYRRRVFLLACEFINKIEQEDITFSFEQKYINRALKNKDYVLWKLISIYILCGYK